MSSTAILTDRLSKQYRLGERWTPSSTLRDAVPALLRRATGSPPKADQPSLWALRDVSLTIEPGDVVGLIGPNGAGKSTLLKILSRITRPTSGSATIRGRVASLLEVGTGFHTELTGRENVFLNGAILGMKQREIRAKLDAIVSFAELEKFIDTPVKHYSSGMATRLAFAIAAHLEPDILILDEVLAVGDLAFQRKCLGTMGKAAESGRTILFVSHNIQAVRGLCKRAVLLVDGRVLDDGPVVPVTKHYVELVRSREIRTDTAASDSAVRRGSGSVRFSRISVEDAAGETRFEFEMGETIRFRLGYEVLEPVPELVVAVALRGGSRDSFVTSARHCVSASPLARGRHGRLTVELPRTVLRPGEYPLYLWLGDREGRPYDTVDGLTAPLLIHTSRGFDELGFDPAAPVGFFSIESRLVDVEDSSSS